MKCFNGYPFKPVDNEPPDAALSTSVLTRLLHFVSLATTQGNKHTHTHAHTHTLTHTVTATHSSHLRSKCLNTS